MALGIEPSGFMHAAQGFDQLSHIPSPLLYFNSYFFVVLGIELKTLHELNIHILHH